VTVVSVSLLWLGLGGLAVGPDEDGDGLPDAWELQYFGNLNENDLGDPDRDGYSNLAEYNNHTNPAVQETAPPYFSAVEWEAVGPGGGGSQYSPTPAPNHPSLMFGVCDMGGFYRSTDGGRHWRMVNGAAVNLVPSYGDEHCGPEFNPQDETVALIARSGGLVRTEDSGLTWRKVSSIQPTAIAFHGLDDSYALFAGIDDRLYESWDGGKSWTEEPGWLSVGQRIRELFVDASTPPESAAIYASTGWGVYKTTDGGSTWLSRSSGLSSGNILDMAGGVKDGEAVLYCTVPTGLSGSALTGGVYRSTDGAESWSQTVTGLRPEFDGAAVEYNAIGVCAVNPDVAYVGSSEYWGPTIYKTTDGGESWVLKLIHPDCPWRPANMTAGRDWITLHLDWGWGGAPWQVKVCATDPDVVAFSEYGRTFRSDDGGNSWFCCNNEEKSTGSDWWRSVGFEVSTVYGYYFDPHQSNRHYIAYTDIGFARSEDAGESWRWSANGSPWRNTFYSLCFDPSVPGLLWAAASNNHDLPHHKMLRQNIAGFAGGILVSTNYGASWRDLGHATGLPTGAATSVVIDPTSPVGSRTLWASVLGRGVFKSTDGGVSWTARNNGLGMPNNLNAWILTRLPDGALYVSVTLAVDSKRKAYKGGLFKSLDGGDHWTLVNSSFDLNWIAGYAVDPNDLNRIYVGCFQAPQLGGGGGYRSTDGGQTWTKILDKADVWKITPDPEAPKRLYACVQGGGSYEGEGLFLSEDEGSTWRRSPTFPFTAYGPQQVHFDPTDSQIVRVTTFGGGLWKGVVPRVLAPTAAFTATVLSGELSFDSSASSGDITTWTWDFGDGSRSHEANPTHRYPSGGQRLVRLTLEGRNGTDSVTRTLDLPEREWRRLRRHR
jgi:photosystem II stability/assembly factor-like uncharacterized protein